MTTTLDTLAATEVMGWQISRESRGVPKWIVPLDCPLFRERDAQEISKCPPFSTNIAHAHMFRDKVLGENRAWAVKTLVHHPAIGLPCTVTILTGGSGFRAFNPSEPTALCLALLRAIGVTEAEIKEAMA